MEAYTVFADIYDEFMNDIPYEMWCSNVHNILENNNIKSGLVVELGCGTGMLTTMFSDLGYEMIGVDNSEDMLSIAREEERDMETSMMAPTAPSMIAAKIIAFRSIGFS